MRITHVIDTHVHADHRSGGATLARKAGALYCLHGSAGVALPFEPLRDGQEIELGNTRIKVLQPPGTLRRASASWSPTFGAAPSRGSS
jgi:hydroxyacylglutathione hydrolase